MALEKDGVIYTPKFTVGGENGYQYIENNNRQNFFVGESFACPLTDAQFNNNATQSTIEEEHTDVVYSLERGTCAVDGNIVLRYVPNDNSYPTIVFTGSLNEQNYIIGLLTLE